MEWTVLRRLDGLLQGDYRTFFQGMGLDFADLSPYQFADAVRTIASRPEAGETKVGDLAGVQVYKFRMGPLLCLLAYRVLDANTLKLLMVGPHENFYRDLKRADH